MAHPGESAGWWALSGWKAVASHTAAGLLALLFLIAGIWKITDPISASVRMTQALVPGNLSLAAALCFGIAEAFSGVLLLVPRFRRWGAILAGALLVAFLVYMGANYSALSGEECNCFPWVKRAVGPAFFIGDAVMLLFAVVAGVWARRSSGVRSALLVLVAIIVFASVSYGVAAVRQASLKAPASITVEGKPFALREGRVFLYFFDPECLHCLDAARTLAGQTWSSDVRVVGVVTEQPQEAWEFMQSSQLQAPVSRDVAVLREAFPFTSAPFGVALENGRQTAIFTYFDASEPANTLRKIGFVR